MNYVPRKRAHEGVTGIAKLPHTCGREALARWAADDHIDMWQRQHAREIVINRMLSQIGAIRLNSGLIGIRSKGDIEPCFSEAPCQPASAAEKVLYLEWHLMTLV